METTTKNRNLDIIILIGLTLLAILTRSYGISQWAINHDEYFTVMHAAERYNSFVNPAYYNLVLASSYLFGVSEWSARLPALLLGILSVPIFYQSWRNVFGRNVAFIASLLIIFSSWHLWYSQFSRFYTGIFLFGSLSYYFYYQSLRLNNLKHLVWSFLTALIAILFHTTSVMIIVSCGTFSAILLILKSIRPSIYSVRVAKIYFFVCFFIGSILFISLLNLVSTRQSQGLTWGDSFVSMIFQILKHVQLTIIVSAFFGALLMLRNRFWDGLFLAVSISLSIGFVMFFSFFLNSRSAYMFHTFSLIFLFSAYFIEQLGRSLPKYHIGVSMITVFCIILLLPEMVSHYTGKKSLDVRDAIEFIENAYQPGDRVLSFDVGFIYYAKDKFLLENDPGNPYVSKNWQEILEPYETKKHRTWIILNRYRKPYAKQLEAWLIKNTSLMWRKFQKRYDYEVNGYEIFLLDKE
jgi:hypothetical protein